MDRPAPCELEERASSKPREDEYLPFSAFLLPRPHLNVMPLHQPRQLFLEGIIQAGDIIQVHNLFECVHPGYLGVLDEHVVGRTNGSTNAGTDMTTPMASPATTLLSWPALSQWPRALTP